MNPSFSLGQDDVRAMMKLVAEVFELGEDRRAWREQLLVGLNELLGTRVGFSGEVPMPGSEPDIDPQVIVGYTPEQIDVAQSIWTSDYARETCPFFSRYLANPTSRGVCLRQDYAQADEWYASETAAGMRELDTDMGVHSIEPINDGRAMDVLSLHPRWKVQMTDRERQITHLVHTQIAPFIGTRLATRDSVSAEDLSTRKRQVLLLLLDGLSDKQIARSLHLSPHTVNDYIKQIHKTYGVCSRAELLAKFLQRYRNRARLDLNGAQDD